MNISVVRSPAWPWKRRGGHALGREQLRLISRIAQTAVVVVGLFFVAAVAGMALYGYSHASRIYEGVVVAGVPVGGLTETEARSRIDARFDDYIDSPISLTGAEQRFEVTPREAGIKLDSVESARAAFEFGRSGPIWSRAQSWVEGALGGYSLDPVISVDVERLDARLTEVAGEVTRPPANASVKMDSPGQPSIVQERPGLAFDLTTTRGNLLSRFTSFETTPVAMTLPSIAPDVTAADLSTGLEGAKAAVGAPLTLSADQKAWMVPAEDLKRIVSVPSEGGVVTVDRQSLRSLIRGIAAELNRPSEDARLYVNDDGEFAVSSGVDAVEVDVAASLDRATEALVDGSHDVRLVIGRQPPAITDAMARAAAADAEQLVSKGLELQWSGGTAKLGRGDLVAAITIDRLAGEEKPFVLGFDGGVLSSLLAPITSEIDIPAMDAKFRLKDGNVSVVSKEQTGKVVDVEAAVVAINEAVLNQEPGVELPIETVKPEYTESYRSKIKVGDVLGDSSTYYGTSSEPRRKNVETAVRLETGWLIPPDGIFSYNEFIGGVTEDQGFVTGFGIVANGAGGVTTAPVIGGGICQVSTTIFQAGYWAGLEVVERYTHPYWLTSYGEAPRGMKGLDAMVNIEDEWSLDLKMRNTTGNWIAVVVRADGERVSAEIVGTDPGWTIEVQGPTISNVVTPPTEMLYTESSELPSGEEMQVESAQDGFDSSIRRVIMKDGQLVDDSTLAGTYAPSRNTILRGTG